MNKESVNNRLIKGLWKLTGLKSSDYIKMAKQVHHNLTGSRLRGLMSGTGNNNYRTATRNDVFQCIAVVSHWVGIDTLPVKTVDYRAIEAMLVEVDKLVECADKDELSKKERLKRMIIKFLDKKLVGI